MMLDVICGIIYESTKFGEFLKNETWLEPALQTHLKPRFLYWFCFLKQLFVLCWSKKKKPAIHIFQPAPPQISFL